MEYETCKILISKGEFKFSEFIKNILEKQNIDLEKMDLIKQRTHEKVIELFYKYPLEFKNCHIHEILKKYENCFIICPHSDYEKVIILKEYYASLDDKDFLQYEKKILLDKIKIIDHLLKID